MHYRLFAWVIILLCAVFSRNLWSMHCWMISIVPNPAETCVPKFSLNQAVYTSLPSFIVGGSNLTYHPDSQKRDEWNSENEAKLPKGYFLMGLRVYPIESPCELFIHDSLIVNLKIALEPIKPVGIAEGIDTNNREREVTIHDLVNENSQLIVYPSLYECLNYKQYAVHNSGIKFSLVFVPEPGAENSIQQELIPNLVPNDDDCSYSFCWNFDQHGDRDFSLHIPSYMNLDETRSQIIYPNGESYTIRSFHSEENISMLRIRKTSYSDSENYQKTIGSLSSSDYDSASDAALMIYYHRLPGKEVKFSTRFLIIDKGSRKNPLKFPRNTETKEIPEVIKPKASPDLVTARKLLREAWCDKNKRMEKKCSTLTALNILEKWLYYHNGFAVKKLPVLSLYSDYRNDFFYLSLKDCSSLLQSLKKPFGLIQTEVFDFSCEYQHALVDQLSAFCNMIVFPGIWEENSKKEAWILIKPMLNTLFSWSQKCCSKSNLNFDFNFILISTLFLSIEYQDYPYFLKMMIRFLDNIKTMDLSCHGNMMLLLMHPYYLLVQQFDQERNPFRDMASRAHTLSGFKQLANDLNAMGFPPLLSEQLCRCEKEVCDESNALALELVREEEEQQERRQRIQELRKIRKPRAAQFMKPLIKQSNIRDREAESKHDELTLWEGAQDQGYEAFVAGCFDKALQYFQEALKKSDTKLEKAKTYSVMADCHFFTTGKHKKVIGELGKKTRDLLEKITSCQRVHDLPKDCKENMTKLAHMANSLCDNLSKDILSSAIYHQKTIDCLKACIRDQEQCIDDETEICSLLKIIVLERAQCESFYDILKTSIDNLICVFLHRGELLRGAQPRRVRISKETRVREQLARKSLSLKDFMTDTQNTSLILDETPNDIKIQAVKDAENAFEATCNQAEMILDQYFSGHDLADE
ncbi:hypothetical protein CI610_01399 [invertebrate metagenome]|uniref:Uncharacterized protein n=1 Tax=invertebrate metagenome TaxID=1711999 RepID=A0A2H9T8S4_9ZZZZ